MNDESRRVQRVYFILLLLHTLAASFIWGINTLFLLDAGLSNAQAFAANAFFTGGLVLFEIPTGVTADVRGRRFSYLLATLTLTLSTFLYLLMWGITAPFWAWALSSMLLGLGFTFFSGAVQAWLIDALTASGAVRQAFVNQLIPSEQRATVLSFDSLMGSAGGVAFQPLLGRAADAWGYPVSYLWSAAIQAVAVPLMFLARREQAPSDPIRAEESTT
jgi:MFS family permease